ncbi:unnamed protein product [Spirodela intermedia]|uniref:Uncharacterized protein n=2 Tax=Spirodela intermedia TaxID=51605 RepID=A0A7I8IFC0_SPIIN|nr:unnamed protein product [Spirodela intermedia]CAA6656389.1 unnamed protein product [Spirodela intermedia]CAA7391959.1 unnamed protein product [Spirodela intermedia]
MGGWRRSVSLMQHLRKERFFMSPSLTFRSSPTASASSCCTLFMSSGLLISSAITHSIADATVSVPPNITSSGFDI